MTNKTDINKDHRYRLIFNMKPVPDGVTTEELEEINKQLPEENQLSACDAAIFLPLIYQKDDSMTMMVLPVDGRGTEETEFRLYDDRVFECWVGLAEHLAQSMTLSEGKRTLCNKVVHIVAEVVQGAARAQRQQGIDPS